MFGEPYVNKYKSNGVKSIRFTWNIPVVINKYLINFTIINILWRNPTSSLVYLRHFVVLIKSQYLREFANNILFGGGRLVKGCRCSDVPIMYLFSAATMWTIAWSSFFLVAFIESGETIIVVCVTQRLSGGATQAMSWVLGSAPFKDQLGMYNFCIMPGTTRARSDEKSKTHTI